MNEAVSLNMANPSAATRIGSIAALVASVDGTKRFFLTCSHVALGGSPADRGGPLDLPETVNILERKLRIATGKLVYARRNATADICLVQVGAPLTARTNTLPSGKVLTQPIERTILRPDQKVGFYSSMRGQMIWGKVLQPVSTKSISLDYGLEICTFNAVIVLSDESGFEPMSIKGDSGSLLFTEDFAPFGILIGGGDSKDYALPLTDMLTLTQTTFI